MAIIETLTAYRCSFHYLKRNNPLKMEHSEAIRAGQQPEFSFEDFIGCYVEYTKNIAIGVHSDRAIAILEENVEKREDEGIIHWHLTPNAGKQGKPIKIVKQGTQQQYNFGPDSVALYGYHVFIYESSDGIIAIFHRQTGSGCKSVFLETANNALQPKGMKLVMDLLLPLEDNYMDASPTKLTMQVVKESISSDIADNLRKRKRSVVREMTVYLNYSDNGSIAQIVKNLLKGGIDRDTAFGQIKAELRDDTNYNDAEIGLQIGKRRKSVRWAEIERGLGVYDITEPLHSAYAISGKYVEELQKISDQYYSKIIESGVILSD